MSIPAPNLDDRRFQDLVDDAKRLVQRRCPEWSDHNVSDPGVTLIEAFATMVDQLLYRLNRVPDHHYLRFLDLLGMRLFPPTAARADVTFWLSAPQADTVTVRAGTEVATPYSELEDAIVFSTTEDLPIVPCELQYVATAGADGAAPLDRTPELVAGEPFGCFGAQPAPGEAFYLGLSNAVPSCAVSLRITCQVEGIGVDPTDPPLRWEAWDGSDWAPCEVDRDETGGLNRSGDVVLHLPRKHAASVLTQLRAGWLRCVLKEPEPDQPFYSASPRIHAVSAFTAGGTTAAVHAGLVRGEQVGISDGSPAQRFPLEHSPVAPGDQPEVLEVGGDEGWQPWTLVESFAESAADDRHFVLDRHAGEVHLGPAIRQPDGTLRQFGAVPPKGAVLRLRGYRVGGGRRGNVRPGALSLLRTSVPYVSRVENRRAAAGGVDGEDVANAKLRAPQLLRTRERAVTTEDFEVLAAGVAPELARVHCVPDTTEPNVVRVLLVPRAEGDGSGQLEFGALRPGENAVRRVAEHLDERRTLGARVVVEPPFYRGVTVVARLTAARHASARLVRLDALEAMYRYLHPIEGGPERTGWPFGRTVQAGDLHALLQRVDGVEAVEDVRLFAADALRGTRSDTPADRVELGPTELVYSFEHQVLVR